MSIRNQRFHEIFNFQQLRWELHKEQVAKGRISQTIFNSTKGVSETFTFHKSGLCIRIYKQTQFKTCQNGNEGTCASHQLWKSQNFNSIKAEKLEISSLHATSDILVKQKEKDDAGLCGVSSAGTRQFLDFADNSGTRKNENNKTQI